jgi:TolB-like protein/Tfp pilus assembly protein PilF
MAVAGVSWMRRERPASPPVEATATDLRSIAVLPFADMSPGKDQEYFTDGLTEELLNSLAKIPELRVTGRTSSFQFKGRNEDMRTIGQKLNVATLLEGSVRKSGDHVRITVQLVKVSDGFHLWSESYDRKLDDIFSVQDDISRAVAGALQVTLLGRKAGTPAPAAEAYNQVLQARHLLKKPTEENRRKARELLQGVLARDPKYAEAWVDLSVVCNRDFEQEETIEARNEALRNQQDALEHALGLDPDMADAHARLARVHRLRWDFVAAEREMKRALELAPGDVGVLGVAAGFASMLGRFDEAIALQKRAQEMDPLSNSGAYNLAFRYLSAGRTSEAEATLKKLLALEPDDADAISLLGDVHLAAHRPDAALAEYEKCEGSARLAGRAMAYHALGREKESRAALQELVAKGGDDAWGLAMVQASLGDKDAAFKSLERAYKERDPNLVYLKPNYVFTVLHSDPRWTALLKRVGLPTD